MKTYVPGTALTATCQIAHVLYHAGYRTRLSVWVARRSYPKGARCLKARLVTEMPEGSRKKVGGLVEFSRALYSLSTGEPAYSLDEAMFQRGFRSVVCALSQKQVRSIQWSLFWKTLFRYPPRPDEGRILWIPAQA